MLLLLLLLLLLPPLWRLRLLRLWVSRRGGSVPLVFALHREPVQAVAGDG